MEKTKPKYFPVAVDAIQAEVFPRFDLYIQRDKDPHPILFRSRSFPFSKDDIDELQKNGYTSLWLDENEYQEYEKYLNSTILSVIQDPNQPLETRCEMSYNLASQLMQEAFNAEETSEIIIASEQALTSLIEVIFADKNAAHNFLVRTSMDYALYTHSVNVCLYGVGVARRLLNISKQDALNRFGPGLLLHDVGKTTISRDILDKPTALTAEEWKVVRQHTIKGLEIVNEFMEVDKETQSIILYHHERLDGSGYPYGLKGNEIGIGARICGLVDAFDAINTTRPFRLRKPSFETLKELKTEIPGKHDEQVFSEFLHLFVPPQLVDNETENNL